MSKKTSDIIKSIHSKSKPISSIIPKSEQPIIVWWSSKLQTKAFDKIACAVADIAAWTGWVPLNRSITWVMSVAWGGDLTADRTVSLVNDEVNPDPNKYYGTDAMWVKWYHSTSMLGGTDLSISNRNDTTLNINSSTWSDVVVPEATQILAGLMTAPDKTKLDGIAQWAEVNVQADWNEADPASDAYILNKPVIPTDTGIIYSLSDGTPIAATIWDRWMASAWAGADKTYETSQTIDPLTGNTINQNFANGTVNFDNTTINNTDSTINNTNTVTNNDEDSDINNNWNTITNTSTTENNIGVTENYDNTSVTNNNGNTTNNTNVTENRDGDNIINLVDGASITNNLDGTVNNNYDEDYIENNIYEEWSTINNTWEVTNNYNNYTENNEYTDSQINNTYTNTETNNYGGAINNYWTTNNYDENSTNNFAGDIYIGGNIINLDDNTNNPTTIVEVWPWLSWTDISNVWTCDGVDATINPVDPTLLDSIQLVVADTISGNDLGQWITSGSPANYGSSSELRGLILTPADVNAATFGVAFKFGDSAWIKTTWYNFAIPLTNTILWIRANVIFTSTASSVAVDCITLTIYHTDNSEFTSWVMVQEAGVDVAQATTLNFQSWATVTDMWGGTVRVDITWGGGWIGLVNIDSANDSLVFAGDPTWTLTGDLPLSADLVHLTTDSWTNLILGIDYTIDITTGILTWILTPSVWETVYARWVTGNRQPGTVPGGLAYYEEFIATPAQTTFILNDTPAGANWIRVSTESSLYGKRTLIASRDRHYDVGTNSIVFEYPLAENDVVSVQYIGFVAQPVTYPVTPVEPITDIVNAQAGDYILITYALGGTTINLPDATTCDGKTVKVKKFTGEDVLVTTIVPFGAQLIDGFTGATMNINRTMYTFTAINGNWYLGD